MRRGNFRGVLDPCCFQSNGCRNGDYWLYGRQVRLPTICTIAERLTAEVSQAVELSK